MDVFGLWEEALTFSTQRQSMVEGENAETPQKKAPAETWGKNLEEAVLTTQELPGQADICTPQQKNPLHDLWRAPFDHLVVGHGADS